VPESKDSKIQQRLAEADEAEQDDRDRIRERKRMRKISRDNLTLKSEIRTLGKMLDEAGVSIEALEALREKPKAGKVMREVKSRRKGKLPVAWVALASDWHTAELVSMGQSNGMNEHSPEIGRERAFTWARNLVTMVKLSQPRLDVKTLVLWLGGDFLVNHGLHYGGLWDVSMTSEQEARMIRNLLVEIIAFLRKELDVERIHIPTSWGNHDRTSEKIVPGHAKDFSHASIIYEDLAAWFAADPSITFEISTSEWNLVDVHGYPILFHHGHAIRYGGGVGGISIPLLKKAGVLSRDYDFRTIVCGHFHQCQIFGAGQAVMNGSLVGMNGYSTDLGLASEPPAQMAFVIDLERLEISDFYRVWGV
jgi:hypothetical protein